MTTTTAPVGEHAELLGTSELVLLGGAPLLLAAAQFASVDPSKDAIRAIQLTQADGVLRIRATNGHIAFRCDLNQGPVNWSMSSDELRLDAKPLRKQAGRAQHLILKGERAELLDAKGKPIDLRLVPQLSYTFPNLDQVWPDQYTFNTGYSIAWNASYMATINDIAARLSDKGNVMFRYTSPNTAVELSCTYLEEITVQFLLMPVMVRAEARTSRDYPPQDDTAAA